MAVGCALLLCTAIRWVTLQAQTHLSGVSSISEIGDGGCQNNSLYFLLHNGGLLRNYVCSTSSSLKTPFFFFSGITHLVHALTTFKVEGEDIALALSKKAIDAAEQVRKVEANEQ